MLLIKDLLKNYYGESGRWQQALWKKVKQAMGYREWGETFRYVGHGRPLWGDEWIPERR